MLLHNSPKKWNKNNIFSLHRSKGKENLSYIKDICYGERYEQHKKVLNIQMQYAIIKTKLKP